MEPVIYIDVVFLENFLMNYLILYCINRYCNYKSKWWRISIGAALGALYVFVLFLKETNFLYSAFIKLLVSILMILLSFRIKAIRKFVKTIILFYIAAFIFAGAILALAYFFDCQFDVINGSFVFRDIKTLHLIIGSILSIILVKIVFDYLENHHRTEKDIIDLKIILENKYVKLKGLIDTGNSLKEPLSNKPVIIVYYGAIEKILSEDLRNLINMHIINAPISNESLGSSEVKNKIMFIPYKTLGVENGTLLGIEVDEIEAKARGHLGTIKKAIIALYYKPISVLEDYEAIVYPEIINGGN